METRLDSDATAERTRGDMIVAPASEVGFSARSRYRAMSVAGNLGSWYP